MPIHGHAAIYHYTDGRSHAANLRAKASPTSRPSQRWPISRRRPISSPSMPAPAEARRRRSPREDIFRRAGVARHRVSLLACSADFSPRKHDARRWISHRRRGFLYPRHFRGFKYFLSRLSLLHAFLVYAGRPFEIESILTRVFMTRHYASSYEVSTIEEGEPHF